MAITYQSIQTASGDDNSVTVTKPTSLAEGDLMIAGIVSEYGGAGNASVNTPSGWTKVGDVDVSTNDVNLAVFYKIADSSDVAASNFTFTSAGSGSGQTLGAIIRATDPGILAGSDSYAETNSSVTLTIPGGFTPTRADCLFVAFVAKSSTIEVGNFTDVSLTTDDPTWTERAELEYGKTGGSYDTRLAAYTATRAEETATGDITVSNTVSDNARYLGFVLAFSPQVNGSITEETKVNAYALSPIPKTEINAVVDDPTIDVTGSPAQFVNRSKNSANWINKDKS